jgi:thimet oligopeptidase
MEILSDQLKDQIFKVYNKLSWTLNTEEIELQREEAMRKILSIIERVEKIPKEERTFENTIYQPSIEIAEIQDQLSNITFLANISTDSSVRRKATETSQILSKFSIELSMRKQSYQALLDLEENLDLSTLNSVDKRLLEFNLRDYKRNGLNLSEENQNLLRQLKTELSQIAISFSQNLNENIDFIELSLEELAGVSENKINSFERLSNGKFKVEIKRPNWSEIMENAKIPETRKKMNNAWDSRCITENPLLLEKVVKIRQQIADLLGYDNYAAFSLEIKMAKNLETVNNFLSDLINKIQPIAKKELATLIQLKNEQLGDKSDGKIHDFDWRYYLRVYREKEFDLNLQSLQYYFPTDHVIKQMLLFYQEIFGYTFIKIDDAPKWHDDVTSYAILDSDTNRFIGVFYLDLFPREGKFGHAAAFSIIKGKELPDGIYTPTASVMVSNFNKPTQNSPSFLSLDQVRTLFHEFGHIIHQTGTTAKYYRFSGTSVSRDFVEAPSQMLENWVLEHEVINMISKHYESGESLPNEILENLKLAERSFKGLELLRQLFFGSYDMFVHTRGKVNAKESWDRLYKEIMMIDPSETANGAATFSHIIGGYDAGYYGYMWSLVIAQDLYTRFKENGPTSVEVGMDYRRLILEPGNEVEENDLVKQFLGREMNNQAFMKHIGLEN